MSENTRKVNTKADSRVEVKGLPYWFQTHTQRRPQMRPTTISTHKSTAHKTIKEFHSDGQKIELQEKKKAQ